MSSDYILQYKKGKVNTEFSSQLHPEGTLRVTQAFLLHLSRDGIGRMINTSGIAGISLPDGAIPHGLKNSATNQLIGA